MILERTSSDLFYKSGLRVLVCTSGSIVALRLAPELKSSQTKFESFSKKFQKYRRELSFDIYSWWTFSSISNVTVQYP